MPLYYFNLCFGERMLPDEEGMELPDRAAAREEALAVVRDLSDREDGRRWASWFLEVADEQGSFLRLPIGYPALEVLPKDGPKNGRHPEPSASAFGLAHPLPSFEAAPQGMSSDRPAALVRQRLAIGQRTSELLQQSRRLRDELSSEFSLSQQIRLRTRRLLSRLVDQSGDGSSAGEDGGRRSSGARPHLVLVLGRGS
jgi:hypothetical protein